MNKTGNSSPDFDLELSLPGKERHDQTLPAINPGPQEILLVVYSER